MTSFSHAQDFAPIGAKWYVTYTHEYFPGILIPPYFFYEVTGDSIILNKQVTVFDAFHRNGFPLGISVYVHQDSGRVYFYEQSEFRLLYDMNLLPGDTLDFDIPAFWREYHFVSHCTEGFKVIVENVDSVIVDGFALKRMRTAPVYDETTDCCIDLGDILERIGSTSSVFGRSCIVHAGDAATHLRCYSDTDLQYSGWGTCDFFIEKPFAYPEAEWYFEAFSPNCEIKTFFRIDVSDMVNDNSTRVIRVFSGDAQAPLTTITVRQDFDRVSFLEDGMYKLLYDFGLEAGDTMTFYLPRIRHHFDFTCNDSLSLSLPYQVLVDSVTMQTIDGLELKSLHTSPLGVDCIDLGIVTEKFGSSNGLFGMHCNVCTEGCSGHFRCYTDEDISYMASSENCDYTTAIASMIPIPDIYFYPNPATNLVSLYGVQSSDISALMLIDGLGRQYQLPVSVTIDVSGITAGCYFLSIILRDGSHVVTRMIKSQY